MTDDDKYLNLDIFIGMVIIAIGMATCILDYIYNWTCCPGYFSFAVMLSLIVVCWVCYECYDCCCKPNSNNVCIC